MIRRLTGKLIVKNVDEVIVDVQGVGYAVALSERDFHQLPEIGQQLCLHIYTHVREDILALYGFGDGLDLRMFQILVRLNGVGPKLALAILGNFRTVDLLTAVREENRGLLQTIPGIGKKTAERMLIDLRDKLAEFDDLLQLQPGLQAAHGIAGETHEWFADLLGALVTLGFRSAPSADIIRRVLQEEPENFDVALKRALRIAGGSR